MTLVPPFSGDPEFSVVMVVHGGRAFAEQAVTALTAHTERQFELTVVDNASDAQTREWLSELPGASVILNDENRGFGPATNQGAQRARGEFLLLLNTDAFVREGWLAPLLEAIKGDGVAAVVPRILNPDGSLQDAGTLLAKDGSVHVYGDGDDPSRFCYRFPRTVDLGSAACMLIRTQTFRELNGFDELFAPAYYEDSDLCLRLAERRLMVRYEPRSTITHIRYGSGSRMNAIALSERHRRLFVERWGSALVGRPVTLRGANEQALIAARDALASPRVVMLAAIHDAAAARAARTLLDQWPQLRLTWATGPLDEEAAQVETWLNAGVEIVDDADPAWLFARLFHYDLLVLDGDMSNRLASELWRTQPQATRMTLPELGDPPGSPLPQLCAALARAGIAPPSASP